MYLDLYYVYLGVIKIKNTKTYEYDVCLSFTEEQKCYARGLGNFLERIGLKVFSDKIKKSQLWGKTFRNIFVKFIFQNLSIVLYCIDIKRVFK